MATDRIPITTRIGCRSEGEGAGVSWGVYPGNVSDEDLASDGWDLAGYEGGPGRRFECRASVRRNASRTLVTQRFGLDI